MAGARDDAEKGVRSDGCSHALAAVDEAGVLRTGHHQHGHLEVSELLPERQLGPCAVAPKRSGEASCGVAEPGRPVGGLVVEGREERAREPFVQESRESLIAPLLDPVGKGSVTSKSRLSLLGIFDTRRRRDEDEPLDGVGLAECQVETDPPAERVPDVGRSATAGRKGERSLGETTRGRRRVAVAGKVGEDYLMRALEVAGDRFERRPRLGEAVHEDEAASLASSREVQQFFTRVCGHEVGN